MTSIRTKWGWQLGLACQGSNVPEAFLAALVANESGGDAAKTRFEGTAFAEMCETCIGKRAHYQALGARDLLLFAQQGSTGALLFLDGLRHLVDLSTSWGLTQIMGYQVIPFHRNFSILMDPVEHLKFAVALLEQFANRWDLSLRAALPSAISSLASGADWEKLFACWNCGEPFPEKTFDPHYCQNGILRMGLYPPAPASVIESA